MDQILVQILNGDLNTQALLILFIIGILTKRFVPWWVHDDVVQELKKYEEDAPQLMDAVQALTEEVRSKGIKSENLEVVEQQQSSIRRGNRNGPYTAIRRRDRDVE